MFDVYPSQDVLCIEMVQWQELVTNTIINSKNQPDSWKDTKNYYADFMTNMVDIVRKELHLLQRNLICCLMVLDVHCRDVIEMLMDEDVTTIDNFNW